MTSKRLIAIVAVLLLPAGSNVALAEPPAELLGKSVVVTWSDTRSQRDGDNPDFHTVNGSHVLSVYISTAGRVFIRQTNTTRRGSGTVDQAPGESGPRTASFDSQSMTVVGRTRGGAQRTLAVFDNGFTRCSATTGLHFEDGRTSVSISPISGRRVEMRSATVNSVGCSLQSGNVLGDD
jgi:streptogramin lyase